nr:ribonuclease H-like domain-containing protein [Tanacetum cinerariifolium]
ISSTITLPSANMVNPVVYHMHTSPVPNFVAGPPSFNAGPVGYSGSSLVYHATRVQQSGSTGPTIIPRQETTLPHAFSVVSLQDPTTGAWNMDTGASFHLNDSVTSLSDIFNMSIYPSVSVGNGHSLPVTNTGRSILPTPTRALHLNNVLITTNIFKNLIYVRQFVHDNNCTVEFDAFGFSVNDFMTRWVIP